jgi:predicted ATPase/DNA-binding SARP family transcriptional activator
MRLCVLGPLEIAGGGRRVSLGSESQRTILAVLITLRGETVSPDRLAEAVWGMRPPASAHKSLHSHVSRLRRRLAGVSPAGAAVVATEPGGYRFELGRHELDADRFEALLARARQELDADPEQALRGLDEALGLWRGAAFGELAVCEFVRPEAVRLNELRAAAIAERVDALLALGDHQGAIGELEAAVAVDPLAERPHGQLMLALYRSGRQADALAVYRRLQKRLGAELGIDPSPEVQVLHERILRHDPDLAAPVSAARRDGGRTSVPESSGRELSGPSAGGLIGRDEDVAAVASLVARAALVMLTGPGGVGKSRLGRAVATAVAERFADGVVVCELAAVADPASVTTALIDAAGAQHRGDRPPAETLLAALGMRQLLLLLDNCEHVLETVATITGRILTACPRVTILATSREVLHLPGERVWEVSPLAVPRAGASAAEVVDAPAGALLCERAQAVEPSFAVAESNAATLAELCRRLDGIPLAIELAAARIRALAPDELAARLDQRFELLTAGGHRGASRHRTLQAVVDWSYGLLTETQARLFDRLTVFAGAFPLEAVEQVCAGGPLARRRVAGVLAELVDKSMVVVDRSGDGVRYRLLDTLRAYGAARLEETGAAEGARRAHATYHVRLVEELAPRVRGRDEGVPLALIDAAIDDLRMAHAWCVEAGDVDGALRLPAALHDYLTFSPRAEVFAWGERALGMPGALEHPARAAALATVARGAVNRGDFDRTRRLADAALDADDSENLTCLWVLYLLNNLALYEGRFNDGLMLADRRFRLAATLREDYHRALAGVSRVLCHCYRGDTGAAVRAAGEARAAAEAAGNHTARAWALYASGEALLDSDSDEATELLEQAIEAARRVGRRFIEGVALVSLASLCARRGDTARALALFRDTVAHWRRLGDYTHQLTTLRNLVDLLARGGADQAAAALYGAVTVGSKPSFGAEAERLAAAWAQVEQRLGSGAAKTAAERGRHQPLAEVVDEALAALETLLEPA